MNTSRPKISVLLPVYNCELYVYQAVQSILNQTFSDFELLVIDDASTDKTVEVIKGISDERLILIQKEVNTGYTNSLNYGLSISKGEFIARMDGDDISHPERFAKQLAFMESHPEVVLCGTGYNILGKTKKIFTPQHHEAIKLALLMGNCIAHPTVMLRNSMLENSSIRYDIKMEPAEDYALWVQLLNIGKLAAIPEVLLEYRVYQNQVSEKRKAEQKKHDITTRFKLLDNLKVSFEAAEMEFLTQCFIEKSFFQPVDAKALRAIIFKMRKANIINYFEPVGFEAYLQFLERNFIIKCFFKNGNFNPSDYFNYILAKSKYGIGLTTKQEVKLLIKCLVFKKI